MELSNLLFRMDFGILSWFGNFLNFLIFLYLIVNVVGSSCFGSSQLLLSLFGLLVSIFVQVIVLVFGGKK